jgi:flagellar biosynthesis protein FliQ
MASKEISFGVGIPMIVVGALMAWLWAPFEVEMQSTLEFVGSLIGILGVVFFVSGLFYTKQPVMH